MAAGSATFLVMICVLVDTHHFDLKDTVTWLFTHEPCGYAGNTGSNVKKDWKGQGSDHFPPRPHDFDMFATFWADVTAYQKVS